VKLVQIAGYLGSGKTTLILALSKSLSEEGQKVAILVNDVGEVPVDGKVMQEYGLERSRGKRYRRRLYLLPGGGQYAQDIEAARQKL
jgi:G3E family GTPase